MTPEEATPLHPGVAGLLRRPGIAGCPSQAGQQSRASTTLRSAVFLVRVVVPVRPLR